MAGSKDLLKIRWWKHRAGSSPARGTNDTIVLDSAGGRSKGQLAAAFRIFDCRTVRGNAQNEKTRLRHIAEIVVFVFCGL